MKARKEHQKGGKRSVFRLYMLTCTSSGKKYVGVTSKSIIERWKSHVVSAKAGSDFYFHKAIRRYGPGNFRLSLLGWAYSWPAICEKERSAIAVNATLRPHGYNLTLGGEGTCGLKFSMRRLEKLNRKWADPEYKARLRAAHRDRMTDPTLRARISASLKKAFATTEQRARRKQALRIRWSDPKRRARQSAVMKKVWANPAFRASVSATQKSRCASSRVLARMSAAMRKRWADPAYKARQSVRVRVFMKKHWAQRQAALSL